jgi:hypothetical protein
MTIWYIGVGLGIFVGACLLAAGITWGILSIKAYIASIKQVGFSSAFDNIPEKYIGGMTLVLFASGLAVFAFFAFVVVSIMEVFG